MIPRRALPRWLVVGAIVAIAACVVGWFATRDVVPKRIRIAAATAGGLYDVLAEALADELRRTTKRTVEVVRTSGAVDNAERLGRGDVELAILQTASSRSDHVAAVAPLFLEPVWVVVRDGGEIRSLLDLGGRRVALGLPNSGMRHTASTVLAHHDLEVVPSDAPRHFDALATAGNGVDAAVVTTGWENPSLAKLLRDGGYRLLGVEAAKAIALRTPELVAFDVPVGLFGPGPPAIPERATPTVAAMAYLAARKDASRALVDAALAALFKSGVVRERVPALQPEAAAKSWSAVALHSAVGEWHDPYGGLGLLANLLESLSAFKELLFAIGAGLWLLWRRRQRKREEAADAELRAMKDHLDTFLEATVRIERQQLETRDPDRLRGHLAEVTKIKLRALEELTHEDLRADQTFAIFLQQCGSLMAHIQGRLARAESRQEADA